MRTLTFSLLAALALLCMVSISSATEVERPSGPTGLKIQREFHSNDGEGSSLFIIRVQSTEDDSDEPTPALVESEDSDDDESELEAAPVAISFTLGSEDEDLSDDSFPFPPPPPPPFELFNQLFSQMLAHRLHSDLPTFFSQHHGHFPPPPFGMSLALSSPVMMHEERDMLEQPSHFGAAFARVRAVIQRLQRVRQMIAQRQAVNEMEEHAELKRQQEVRLKLDKLRRALNAQKDSSAGTLQEQQQKQERKATLRELLRKARCHVMSKCDETPSSYTDAVVDPVAVSVNAQLDTAAGAAGAAAVSTPATPTHAMIASGAPVTAHVCKADAIRYCPLHYHAQDLLATLDCLNNNKAKLSEACRAEADSCPAFACAKDSLLLCADVHQRMDLVPCLREHAAQLSSSCLEAAKKHQQAAAERQQQQQHQYVDAGASATGAASTAVDADNDDVDADVSIEPIVRAAAEASRVSVRGSARDEYTASEVYARVDERILAGVSVLLFAVFMVVCGAVLYKRRARAQHMNVSAAHSAATSFATPSVQLASAAVQTPLLQQRT